MFRHTLAVIYVLKHQSIRLHKVSDAIILLHAGNSYMRIIMFRADLVND